MSPTLRRQRMDQSPSRRAERVAHQEKQARWYWLKRYLMILALVVVVATVGIAVIKLTPNAIECTTAEHTYCPEEVNPFLEELSKVPWRKFDQALQKAIEQLQLESVPVVDGAWHPTLKNTAEITLTFAQPVYPFWDQDKTYLMLSNGQIKSLNEPRYPVLEFSRSVDRNEPSSQQRNMIGVLYGTLERITPRVKHISIQSWQEVVVTLENQKQFLLRLDDPQYVSYQVSTLQSFLRSSTMEPDYQVIDLRFAGQVIVRE